MIEDGKDTTDSETFDKQESAQLYTGITGALRSAESSLREADDFRKFPKKSAPIMTGETAFPLRCYDSYPFASCSLYMTENKNTNQRTAANSSSSEITAVLSINYFQSHTYRQKQRETRTHRQLALGSDFYCLVRVKGLEPS